MHVLVKDNVDNSGLGFIERQLVNLMLALIHAPAFHKVIAVGGDATLKASILHELPQGGFGADGGFFAFAVRLPEPDVVGEFVGVVVKSLLTLYRAPPRKQVF